MLICSKCNAVLGIHASVCPNDGGTPSTVNQIPPGAILGGYRVEKLLGEGGMGFVYEAVHEVLGRRCALKVLRPEFSTDANVVTRFLQEAKAVNVINQRHIVNVYDYGDDIEGLVYFVMEYLEGETLQDLMERHKAMAPALLLHIFTQILLGLAAAHKKQIIHRDLKPENVFVIARVGNPVFVKLLDFGVAKLRGEGAVEGLTGSGSLIGTPQFMSPEQFRGQPVDTRSDVFSLGIMMYAAATGRLPFLGEDLAVLALGIIKETPPAISDLVPGTPPALIAFIERALEKEPEKRFEDASDMLLHLERVQAQVDADRAIIIDLLRKQIGNPGADIEPVIVRSWEDQTSSEPAGAPSKSLPRPQPASRGKSKGLLLGAGALALALAGALAFVVGGSSDDSGAADKKGSATESRAGSEPSEAATRDLKELVQQKQFADLRREALEEMELMWKASDAALREEFVDALARVGSSSTEPLLVHALLESPQTLVQAAQALRDLGKESAVGPLQKALERSGAQLQADLAATLLALGDQSAKEILKESLSQTRSQFPAALALVKEGSDRREATKQIIRDVFVETPPWKGRWLEAVDGLLSIDDEAAEEALVHALGDKANPANQVAAAALLARYKREAGIEYLSAVVGDARSNERADAALALAKSAHDDARLYVPVGLMSDDTLGQVTAIAILSRLGGDELAKQATRLAGLAQDGADPVVTLAALAALASLPD